MNKLRSTISALLDKVASLLQGEPVRLIGYSAAVVIYGAIYVLNAMDITRFGEGLSFEAALTLSLAAVGVLTLFIERLRMFVYSPLTYIEDLADEAKAAHEAAHVEEDMQRAMAALAEAAVPKRTRVSVGTVKSAAAGDAKN